MIRLLILFGLFLLILCHDTEAQFGTHPFGQNPFSGNGAFGLGPYGSGGSSGNIPNGAIQDDSGHYIQDDAGHYIIAG